ncbi:MAG: thioredoxin-disulfide reductase [Acidobacteria bacterium]|nr:thioredoxin-disulfide reductase [Acidobacteriota bacterium]
MTARPQEEGSGSEEPRNVIILGSGCAGLTAAVYAARANLAPLLIDGHESGGQLGLTTDVENYPGFPNGVLGPELIQNMREQSARFGTEFLSGSATSAELSRRPFRITIDKVKQILTRTLIIGSGASARLLGLESERRLLGHGLSTSATCDGFFYKGKEVAVVGGGDSAMEEGLFLTKFATRVTVIHRRDMLRASKIMQDRALKNEKMKFAWNSVVEEILGEERVEGIRIRDAKTGAVRDLKLDGVFVAIGHIPNTSIFEGQIEMDKTGYIITHEGSRTSVEGVFAAGDCQDHVYRQAVTAAGSGCMAAIDVERFLESQAH